METITAAKSRLVAVFVLAFILQATLGRHGRFVGAHLDFLLILALSAALLIDRMFAVALAFFLGILTDALLGGPIGFAALLYSVSAYVVGSFRRRTTPSVTLSVLVGGIASAAVVSMYVVVGRFVGAVTISLLQGLILAIFTGAIHGLVVPIGVRLLTAFPNARKDASWL